MNSDTVTRPGLLVAIEHHPLALFEASAIGLERIDRTEANALLVEWGHYLGPINRPFGFDAWILRVAGAPVSLAVGVSTVSTTVAGLSRYDVIELGRLCSAPDAAWATRPMLRLWREVCAPAWSKKYPRWTRVAAAVAYSQNAHHPGNVYRFDGWERVTDQAGKSGGGGSWSGARRSGDAAHGAKSLWIWRYPNPLAVCAHCHSPVASPLAGCDRPECVAKDIAIEAAFKRRVDT